MSEPALSMDALGYRAGNGRMLVEPTSLEIGAEQRLAIIGPNGAGKSTLLRMMAGLLKPSSGSVRIHGDDIAALRPLDRARLIAVVGQTDAPAGQLLVQDYVALGRIPHSGAFRRDEDAAIVEEALVRVDLAAFARRPVASLSGGERQRMQLARALCQKPKVLFLDEPTNHLDPRARSELLALVGGLGVTTIAVLHDLPLVAPFATRIAVMQQGRVVATGTPDECLTPRIVSDVFALDVLRMRHPSQDRDLMVFEASLPHSASQPIRSKP